MQESSYMHDGDKLAIGCSFLKRMLINAYDSKEFILNLQL